MSHRHEPALSALTKVGLAILFALYCLLAWKRAHAIGQESPAPMVAPAVVGKRMDADADGGKVSLQLARACWLEATWSLSDCAAIHGVIKRRAERAGWTYERMLLAYSALDAQTDRAAVARALPDGDVPGWTAKDNGRWSNLRDVARGAIDGDVPTPCQGATQWGGSRLPRDHERIVRNVQAGRWRVLRCSRPTANTFLEER